MSTAKRTFTWRKSVPQELAQFVLPELPEPLRWPLYISRLDLLANEGRASVVHQLYQQLLKLKLTYEVAPFDPLVSDVQQIRRPSEILSSHVGTCVDLTLLLAGMCLAADLLPLVVVFNGHALLAVSLTHNRPEARNLPQVRAFAHGLLRDLHQMQKWADDEVYLLVECTGVAASQGGLSTELPEGAGRDRRGFMAFDRACEAGLEQIMQHAVAEGAQVGRAQRTFLFAVHVHELQQRGFKPLTDEADPSGSGGTTINQSGQINLGQVGKIDQFVAGDAVAGDKFTGDKVQGDKVQGDQSKQRGGVSFGSGNKFGDVKIGDIAGRDIIKTTINAGTSRTGRFAAVYARIEASDMNSVLSPLVSGQVGRIEAEAALGAAANREVVRALLASLAALAPDVRAEVVRALAGTGLAG